MKFIFLTLIVCYSMAVSGQSLSKMPDSVRKVVDEYNGVGQVVRVEKPPVVLTDDAIKEKLVKFALTNNAEITTADANIRIAQISRRKANSSMLSSINLGANANEFVINNSPQANFFPKYNLGVSIPLDLFAKNKAEKQTATQMITMNAAQKELVEKDIRTRVLILYETYKEKKQIVELQKMAMEDDIAAYEKAQQDYAENIITLEDVSKIYKASVNEKSILATKQKEFNISVIELESAIGVPLSKALN
ncbi:MAG: TolC family protein [Rhizobacter sp.]|nr:TolC family protein [Ferruginibacter sp.]